MFCHLKSVIFFVLLIVIGCSQEKSVEPYTPPPIDTTGTGTGTSGGTAEFAFIASAGVCSDAAAGGDFQAGKVLGLDAQITVTVNVTKTGDWTLSTNSVNGFIFIGAGTFTATGSQSITLQGVGKPTAAGLNTFAVKGCSVLVAVIPGTNDNGSATDYYYKLIIDGKTYQQTVTTNNDYIAGSSLSSSGGEANLSASIEYYISGQSSVPKGKTTFTVTKGTFHGYYNITVTNDVFKSFFTVRSYTVIKSFADGDGITMEWLDAAGERWNTNGDQTGSTFNIVSVTDSPDSNGTFYLKTKMQFKCKLYNMSTGVMKQVTSGEMISFFGHI